MNPLKDILTGNDGSYSLVKVIVFAVICAIVIEHVYLTIHTGTLQPWDWTQIGGIVGALAAALGHAAQDDKPAKPVDPPAAKA